MRKNLKKLATIFLAVAMIFSIAVPAFAANDSYSDTTYGYRTNEYEFGKISHPNNATSTPDGLVDYMGNGMWLFREASPAPMSRATGDRATHGLLWLTATMYMSVPATLQWDRL